MKPVTETTNKYQTTQDLATFLFGDIERKERKDGVTLDASSTTIGNYVKEQTGITDDQFRKLQDTNNEIIKASLWYVDHCQSNGMVNTGDVNYKAKINVQMPDGSAIEAVSKVRHGTVPKNGVNVPWVKSQPQFTMSSAPLKGMDDFLEDLEAMKKPLLDVVMETQ